MKSCNSGERGLNDWKYLWSEMKRRTSGPFCDVPFVIYVLLAIVGLGCLGIWVELIKVALSAEAKSYDGVVTALATFFPALVGSSSLQLILASTGRSDKILVAFGCFTSIGALAGAVLISLFHRHQPTSTLWFSVLFAIAAVWLWWFVNGDDPIYKSTPIDAPSGGDTGKVLKGDTTGFRQ